MASTCAAARPQCVRGSSRSSAPHALRAPAVARRQAAAAVTCASSSYSSSDSGLILASQQPIMPPRSVAEGAWMGGLAPPWAARRAAFLAPPGNDACSLAAHLLVHCRTQDMAGDPFGLLLRQRIVFFGGEVRRRGPCGRAGPWHAGHLHLRASRLLSNAPVLLSFVQSCHNPNR